MQNRGDVNMKKGFTLIELLAVIIILTVTAVIAVPTFTKIIEKTKKEAIKSSALTYMNAVEDYSVIGELKDSDIVLQSNQKYNCVVNTIIEEKNILPLNEIINIKGYKPTGRNDYLELGSKGEVVSGELNIGGYLVTIKDKEISSIIKGEKVDIESMTLNYTEQTMEKGSTFRLRPIFNPIDTSDQRVTYKSSDSSIIKVSDDGTVTALKNGTAKVTVTSKDNTSIKAECNITVVTSASSISLTPTESEIEVGSSVQLTGTIEPGDVTTNSLTWVSSNEDVAHVDENGLVTGMSVGNATITAKTVNGKTATANITVSKVNAESIVLDKTSIKVQISRKNQLIATISPSNTTDKNVTWTSSDESIATVSNDGVVEGKALGTVTITAKTHNNLTATANITVTDYCDYLDDEEIVFDYTGNVQTFTPKCDGKYKLEVWGAQGGGDYPGYGGYSVGTYPLTKNQSIYVYVGGQGLPSLANSAGGNGYNGGGQGYNGGGGGGGMTHISKTSTDNPTSSWTKNSSTKVTSLDRNATWYKNFGSGTVSLSSSSTSTRNYKLVASGTANHTMYVMCYTTSYTIDPYCKVCVGGTEDSKCKTNDDAYNSVASGQNCYAEHIASSGESVYCYVAAYKTYATTTESGTATWKFEQAYPEKTTTYSYSNTHAGNFDVNTSNLIIVAGGGGGSTDSESSRGGDGGGYQSSPVKVSGTDNSSNYYANQTTGYTQGKGASASVNAKAAGAGSGWYGGKVSNNAAGGAGGGSGWIQNSSLIDKHMTCYNCPTSTTASTKTQSTTLFAHAESDKANTGNGYARITYLGK